MTAVNVKMGQVTWQAARLAKAQLRLADGELIAPEKDGSRALTQGHVARLRRAVAGGAPEEDCLDTDHAVRTKLYLRDHASVVALDLGA